MAARGAGGRGRAHWWQWYARVCAGWSADQGSLLALASTIVDRSGQQPGHCAVQLVPERNALQRFLQRSEEHTSELQSLAYLVCRLLLEKKKNINLHTSIE